MKLLLHSSTTLQLTSALPSGAGSVIFHGPAGVGKRSAALELGRTRNCNLTGDHDCSCHSCTEWRVGNFPDLIQIGPTEKASIGVEEIRNLTQRLSLAPYYENGSRIVIIDSAEALTVSAQNALLKLIEEPPSRTNIFLIATSLEHLLPTVRSRCRSIYFPALTTKHILSYFEQTHGIDPLLAKDLAELSGGAIGTGVRLKQDHALLDSRTEISSRVERFLSGALFERLILAKELGEQKAVTSIVIELLYQHISLGTNPNRLIGLERLRSQLASNVAPRAAYERFALELGA